MGKLRTLVFLQLLALCFATLACASSQIWDSQGNLSSTESLTESLKTHGVIILGENHGLKTHQEQHLMILNNLKNSGRSVHVGLEFFSYPFQNQVDSYRLGKLDEADFLKSVEWGGTPYEFYRPQALFPDYSLGERTWALNAPRALTGQIAKVGIAQLTPELAALMPPDFQVGRDSYKERFLKIIGDHVKDPAKQQYYFEAQSVWDDTMAWRIQTFREQHPTAVLVVIVGEFHVQYGGGLPARLKSRGIHNVLIISQVDTRELNAEELQKQIKPDPEYGPRADWIWSAPAVD